MAERAESVIFRLCDFAAMVELSDLKVRLKPSHYLPSIASSSLPIWRSLMAV